MEGLLDNKIFKSYLEDLHKCQNAGQKGSDCAEIVHLKYLRKIPGFKGMIYPWKNYDWNYQGYIDNVYNSKKTGATPKGNFPALFKNPKALTTLLKGFVETPNPGNSSKSNKSDQPKCHDKGCKIIKEIKDVYNQQKVPYPDKFFDKKLDGKNSSSYFIKTGSCEKSDLSKKECLNKGYTWKENPLYKKTPSFLRPDSFKEGECYKEHYAFIKNDSGFGLGNFKGELPSVVGDLLSLSPINLYKIIKGEKAMDLETTECFIPYNCHFTTTFGITNIQYILILIIFIVWIMIAIMFLNTSLEYLY